MKEEKILKLLNNPSFKVDLTKMMFKTYQLTLLNNEYLQRLLEQQIEIKELLKGKTKSEIDDSLLNKLDKITEEIFKAANTKIPEDVNFFSKND